MKPVSDRSESERDIPRAYSGEAERGQGFMAHAWSESTDSWDAAKPRRQAVAPVSQFTFAAWGGEPDRGIPELASPLAD